MFASLHYKSSMEIKLWIRITAAVFNILLIAIKQWKSFHQKASRSPQRWIILKKNLHRIVLNVCDIKYSKYTLSFLFNDSLIHSQIYLKVVSQSMTFCPRTWNLLPMQRWKNFEAFFVYVYFSTPLLFLNFIVAKISLKVIELTFIFSIYLLSSLES